MQNLDDQVGVYIHKLILRSDAMDAIDEDCFITCSESWIMSSLVGRSGELDNYQVIGAALYLYE